MESTATMTQKSTEQPTCELLILTEYELKKRALEEAKKKLQNLAYKNERLSDDYEAAQKESYEVTEALRRELREKAAMIEQMRHSVQKKEENLKQEMHAIEKKSKKEVEVLRTEFCKRKNDLEAKIQDLQKELKEVHIFRDRQKEFEEIVFNFQTEKKLLEERRQQEKIALEKNFFEESSRLKIEFEHQISRQKRQAEIDKEESLNETAKRILNQNRQLSIELNLHKQETRALHRELSLSENERDRLAKELEFRIGLEESFADRNVQQGLQLKASKSKCQSLEQSMKQLIVNMNKSNEENRKKTNRQLEDLQFEIEGLRKLVKKKNRESLTMRHVAQQVLMQRKDVERFLLSSIEMVRKERGNVGCAKREEGDSCLLDVAVEEMGWIDRERVLKILFSKLRNQSRIGNEKVEMIHGLLSKEGPVKPNQ